MRKTLAGNGKTGTSGEAGREANPPAKGRPVTWSEVRVAKRGERVPGKAAIVFHGPVPQTDTGGWGENPKAGGRSIVKELGKMTP